MALVGAMIVFSGLIILSFAIAQLHKVLKLIDKKKSPANLQAPAAQAPPNVSAAVVGVLTDPAALAEAYDGLAKELGETFQLADLYALALRDDLPHPHLSIRRLREAQRLLSQGEGVFAWHDNNSA